MIGLGSFGTVVAGTDRTSGQSVAIKIMPKQRGAQSRETTLSRLVKEVAVMQELQGCPSMVRLLACYEDDQEVQVVMELCGGGDLQQLSEVSECVCVRWVSVVGVSCGGSEWQ